MGTDSEWLEIAGWQNAIQTAIVMILFKHVEFLQATPARSRVSLNPPRTGMLAALNRQVGKTVVLGIDRAA